MERAVQQLVYRQKIRDLEQLKEMLHSCWAIIIQDLPDSTITNGRNSRRIAVVTPMHDQQNQKYNSPKTVAKLETCCVLLASTELSKKTIFGMLTLS